MKWAKQRFGGDWTNEKLERVRKYLSAYTTIMSRQPFRFAYDEGWYDVFYRTIKTPGLFGEEEMIEKIGDFSLISQYFVRRLKTVFAGVADNPLPLLNSHNNPLYLLCFASGNPKGAKTAIKIAQDILRRE